MGRLPLNYLGGTLSASVTGSQFTSLLIEQDGCCPAHVALTGDTIPGNVQVYEGLSGAPHNSNNGNGADSITVDDVKFGATTLYQYYAPTVYQPGVVNDGHGDTIMVNQTTGDTTSNIASLWLYQGGTSGNQLIDVGTSADVQVSSTSFGIYAAQPNDGTAANGNGGSTIHIESITVFGRPSDSTRLGPPSISTLQGNAGGETTIVDSSTVYGNITVLQGNGGGDAVHIANDVIGLTVPIGPYLEDFYGTLFIKQGNGGGDLVQVDSNGSESGVNSAGNVFNNVYIFQGNGGGASGGTCTGYPGYDDVVIFDEATVYSDLVIIQNAPSIDEGTAVTPSVDPSTMKGDGGGDGNNLVQIGVASSATKFGAATGAVSVGEETYVFQGGAGNEVDLGGTADPSGIDFETTYLDIYTGAGGGGFVMATNTVVDVGSFFNLDWVINGGGTGNVYVDGGGNSPSPLPYSSNYSG